LIFEDEFSLKGNGQEKWKHDFVVIKGRKREERREKREIVVLLFVLLFVLF
jgi:hypothetical protein